MIVTKDYRRARIHNRIRKIVEGTSTRPRLNVFRSNIHINVQLIDDSKGLTLVSASSSEKVILESKVNKVEQAKLVGKLVAEKALKAGISEIVFDRGGYLYHGRVKSLADAARESGLKF